MTSTAKSGLRSAAALMFILGGCFALTALLVTWSPSTVLTGLASVAVLLLGLVVVVAVGARISEGEWP